LSAEFSTGHNPQFGAKIQHQEAFVNSFNPFFDFKGPWVTRFREMMIQL
jgi:hypothetical protein